MDAETKAACERLQVYAEAWNDGDGEALRTLLTAVQQAEAAVAVVALIEQILAATDDGYHGGFRITRPNGRYLISAGWMNNGVKTVAEHGDTLLAALKALAAQVQDTA